MSRTRTFKLTLAYDGTAFCGWQLQANQRSVQGVCEEALRALADRRVVIHAAGRTDSGVHAIGQVISFDLETEMASEKLWRALNVRLPFDVRVLGVEEAAPSFNARYDARRKTYRYDLDNATVVLPQRRHFVWHLRDPLDVAAMGAAAATLLGTHDFVAFQAAGGDVFTSRRQLTVSQVRKIDSQISYEVTGSGFLRHMVRNIVGTLVDIGRGRRSVDAMREVLLSRDRAQASATAPPHGLTLWSVEY